MTAGPSDPTGRFTDRVDDYARSRPGYPPQVLAAIRDDLGLRPEHVVADIGSGTGLLSRLFVENGNLVYGVEPNVAMAAVAASTLGPTGRFHGVGGRAEQTGLDPASVDLVTAGQSFHWFAPAESRAEFLRILRPPGRVALVWNLRRLDSTPFLRDYEDFVRRWSTDYAQVAERYAEPSSMSALFGGTKWQEHRFDNRQDFDLAGLRERLISSSYTPRPGDPRREQMLAALPAVFAAHAREGTVAFEYDTRVFTGRIA